MTNKKLIPKYWTNKSIRTKIDKLLEQNASNVANSGIGSKNDIGDEEQVKNAWIEMQKQIKDIDSVFYEIIKER